MSDRSKALVVGVLMFFSISALEIWDVEEIEEGDEGEFIFEWSIDLDLLAIHSFGPHPSVKNMEASKIVASNIGGKPPGPDLRTTPFPFGVVALTEFIRPVS